MDGKTFIGIGVGALIAGVGMAIAVGVVYTGNRADVVQAELGNARVERGYVLQERDLNNNGLPERFYLVDGNKYFLEIDGKNLEGTLRE